MDTPAPLVSIVIPTIGSPFLAEQLASLSAQIDAPRFEVLVADNGAPGDLAAELRSWVSQLDLRVVDARGRTGTPHGRNVGAREARGQYLFFLDDDDVTTPDYVRVMVEALHESPAVAARVDLTSLNPGWRSEVRDLEQTRGLGAAPEPWAYGATLGVRRDVFEQVGGFTEDLGWFAGEDVDWCRRLARTGHELRFVPEAVLRYRLRSDARSLWRQGLRYGGAVVIDPSLWTGWGRWCRSLLGPMRLVVFGRGKAARRRGVFLLGRRVGIVRARRRGVPNPPTTDA